MDITFADLVRLNAMLKERGLRYRVGGGGGAGDPVVE